LRALDGAHRDGDAEALELRLVEQDDALEGGIVDQHLDAQRLASLDVDQLAVADLVAGFLQEPRRLFKRYMINNPLFVYKISLQLLGLRDYHVETK